MIKLRVSNIDASASKHDLERLFEEYGDVDSVKLFRTPNNGPSLAFVVMFEKREGQEAIDALQGESFKGSNLMIEESRDKIVKKTVSLRPKAKVISLEDDDDTLEKEIINKDTFQGSAEDLREKDSEKWSILKKKKHAKEVGKEEYSYDDSPKTPEDE